MIIISVLIAGLLGAFIGSFLGVVIHRLPQGKSIVSPPSHCDDCGTVLRWYDNIPVIGWALLRGRCRWCGAKIPFSVWLIEIVTGCITAAVTWYVLTHPAEIISPLGAFVALYTDWQWFPSLIALIALLVVSWSLLVSTATDLAHMIIPDELSKPLQVAAPFLSLCALGTLVDGEYLQYFFAVRSEVGDGGQTIAMFSVFGGAILVGGIVVLAALVLVASLPFARWVYGTRLKGPFPWKEDDHRSFAKGLWWYVIALIPALGCLLIMSALSQPGISGDLPLYMVYGLSHALLGSLCGWYLPYAIGLFGSWGFHRNALGYGDVKMLAWMGCFLGPVGVLYTFFLAAIFGTIVGIPMRFLGGGRELPFGPYLVLGAVAAYVWGSEISHWLTGHIG